MSKIAVIRDPLYLKHSNMPGHPECAERLKAIDEMLEGFHFKDQIEDIQARDATLDELSWVHDDRYIKRIENTKDKGFTMLDPDTSTNSYSFEGAVRAAGGTMEAVNAVLTEQYKSAFAFVRPPGHHAEAGSAMGFCLFNNIAVGALYAIKKHGLKRVLIVDWDVHHGNGTMNSFYESDQVMYFSIHEYPHYPGTGRVNEIGRNVGEGYTVNVPLGGGQGDEEYMSIFHNVFQPIALEFSPELILVSAGFDAHKDDQLADMSVTSRGYGKMIGAVMEVANECCPGRIALVLEGGYNLKALSESISNVLCALLGEQHFSHAGIPPTNNYISGVIENIKAVQRAHWKLE